MERTFIEVLSNFPRTFSVLPLLLLPTCTEYCSLLCTVCPVLLSQSWRSSGTCFHHLHHTMGKFFLNENCQLCGEKFAAGDPVEAGGHGEEKKELGLLVAKVTMSFS